MKSAVIYWSQTGNTKLMAEEIAKQLGADIFEVSQITPKDALNYDKLALGCPAMGSESLEDDHFEPFIDELYKNISGKKVALFGSYGWGDGYYMQEWEDRTTSAGAQLFGEGLTVNETPDEKNLKDCLNFAKEFKEF